MSGVRWTTGLGIVIGGVGGAVAALLGAVSSTPPTPVAEAPREAVSLAPPAVASAVAEAPRAAEAPSAAEVPRAVAEEPPATTATVSATTLPAQPSGPASAAPAALVPSFGAAPALQLPTTRDALLTAEMYCDKRQDFDECERAAAALESGSAGPADPKQAKRFRRIALTHLVAQCEAGSPHACFIMAAKYRAGAELTASPVRAEALEKRGLELCRLGRSAPECPPSR